MRTRLLLAAACLIFLARFTDAQCPGGPGGAGPNGGSGGPSGGPSGPGGGGPSGGPSGPSEGGPSGASGGAGRGASTGGGSALGALTGARPACAPAVRGLSGRKGATTGACSGTELVRERDSWQTWWDRNLAEFVWNDAASGQALRPRPVTAAGSGALVGLGRRTADERPARGEIYTHVVPSLLELLTDPDTEVVDAAARALGATVEAPFGGTVIEALQPLLEHHDLRVQTSATLALGLLGDAQAGPLLLDLARCSSAGHRLVGGASEVPRTIRLAATLALGYADDPASVAALIDLVERLPESESETRQCAVHALGIMRNPETRVALSYLGAKLSDERLDPRVRAAIPTALARHGQVDAIDPLLALCADRDTDDVVRQSAVIALGRLADVDHARVLEALQHLAEDAKNAPTRHFAYISLGRIGARSGSGPDEAGGHQRLERWFVGAIDEPARSIDRPWAALAAGAYAHGHAASRSVFAGPLQAQYDDLKDPEMRGAFALALGLARVQQAAPALRADFEHAGDEAFASHLALALGLMGDEASAGDLHAVFNSQGRDPALIYAAGLACRLLGDQGATTIAADRLDDEGSLDGRLGLAAALGAIGQRSALAALHAATLDQQLDPTSRAGACLALGRVTGTRTAPWQSTLLVDSNYMLDESLPLEEIVGRL